MLDIIPRWVRPASGISRGQSVHCGRYRRSFACLWPPKAIDFIQEELRKEVRIYGDQVRTARKCGFFKEYRETKNLACRKFIQM